MEGEQLLYDMAGKVAGQFRFTHIEQSTALKLQSKGNFTNTILVF